jgi:hypothetical protein
MEKQKYEVRWKAEHFTVVDAENETEAFEKAAQYAQGFDTCVDEDDYECRLAGEPGEVEQTATVIRDALSMRRVIEISVDNGTAIITDRLIHPLETHSRMHKTVMEADMLEDLIRQLDYVKMTDEVEP